MWFRRDLRLADNPALFAAASGGSVLPCFILDDAAPETGAVGGAARWWLHHSLAALQAQLAQHGLPLLLRRGPAATTLAAIAHATGARRIHACEVPEPQAGARDAALTTALAAKDVALCRHRGRNLLFPPPQPLTGGGGPYRVFTPFWRACRARPEPAMPQQPPRPLSQARPTLPADLPGSGEALADWHLLPRTPDWSGGLQQCWSPGEGAARDRLAAFLAGPANRYAVDRDFPDGMRTSRLSPHLHWGEISANTVWHAVRTAQAAGELPARHAEKFLTELGWREFCHHLLHHHPLLPARNLNPRFDRFAWRDPKNDAAAGAALRAWQHGRTGYPVVDAGMRELQVSGWMHNRARMVAASFLVKHLRIDWRHGADWFDDQLVDADLASNRAGWQWVAGSGADAAPFFRIFNPILQGQKFDPEGGYVRRWLPELEGLPDRHLHAPWQAPSQELANAGIELGHTYPHPIVEHRLARREALAAFAATGTDPVGLPNQDVHP